jgi:peptide-methionine (R)-S-oxide reductase
MKSKQFFTVVILGGSILSGCSQSNPNLSSKPLINMSDTSKIVKSEEEWKKTLTEEEFNVLRKHGTERAFTGDFYNHHEKGVYTCAACGTDLFTSETKFESGTGWPSYYQPANEKCVEETIDKSFGMVRVEVHCAKCGGHLGHKFDDGPNPTGLRYCINSISLDFKKEE